MSIKHVLCAVPVLAVLLAAGSLPAAAEVQHGTNPTFVRDALADLDRASHTVRTSSTKCITAKGLRGVSSTSTKCVRP